MDPELSTGTVVGRSVAVGLLLLAMFKVGLVLSDEDSANTLGAAMLVVGLLAGTCVLVVRGRLTSDHRLGVEERQTIHAGSQYLSAIGWTSAALGLAVLLVGLIS